MTFKLSVGNLPNIQEALAFSSLKKTIDREMELAGERIVRNLRKQTLYKDSIGRGALKVDLKSKPSSVAPEALDFSAQGELSRSRSKPLFTIKPSAGAGSAKTPRSVNDGVRIRYRDVKTSTIKRGKRKGKQRRRVLRRPVAGRKVLSGLYSRKALRTGGNRSLRRTPVEFLFARRIAHSDAVYGNRIDKQIRKQFFEANRRIGFAIRKRLNQ